MAENPFGGTSTKKKKPKAPNPKKQLIQRAARVANMQGPARQQGLEFLGDTLQGIPNDKLYKIGEKAGLSPGDIDKVRAAAAAGDAHNLIPYVLDMMDRPVQMVKGSVVEPDNLLDVRGYVEGGVRGLTGKEKYSGSEAALSAVGAFKGEADDEKIRKQVEGLPGPVRMGLDFAVDVVADPTTYITFGGGTIAENAAKAVAKNLAGSAAERGMSVAAQEVFERLAKKGAKALSPQEVTELQVKLGAKRAKRLLRRANKAQGGMYVAGKKIPGSQIPQQAARNRGVLPEGWGSATEQLFRTEAGARQATRAGLLPQGTPGSVEAINEGRRAADTGADLAQKAVQKRAAVAVGRVQRAIPDSVDMASLSGRAQKRIIKAGERAIQKSSRKLAKGETGPVDLDAVREALDVNGGPAAVAALPDAERALATELRAILDEGFAERVASGRLMDDVTAPKVKGEQAARKDLGKAAKVEPRLRALEGRRIAAQRRVDELQSRLDELDAEAEFVDVPALRRPGDQVDYFPKSDITLTKRIGETRRLLEREKTLLRQISKTKDQAERSMVRSLQRAEGKRAAAVAGHTPEDRYFPHFVTEEAQRQGYGRARRDVPTSQMSGAAPGFTKRRKFKGAASEASTDLGDATYELNPVVAVGRSAKMTKADAGRIQMFDEIQRLPGQNGQPIVRMGDDVAAFKNGNATWRDEYVELKQPVTREAKDGSGRLVTEQEPVLVQKEIAGDFKKVVEATPDLLEKVRWLNSMWARWATATTGFISRNVLQGNLYMGMVLAEARDVRVWADTMKLFKRINRGVARYGDPLRFIDDADKALVREAMDHGVISSGFYDDLAAATARVGQRRGKILGGKGSPLSPNFMPVERISAANQWMENWSRLSVYRNKVKQGFTPEQAALITDKYMLNYRNLSKVNDAGRVVSPFLTWVYKSTPMIMGEVARSPRKAMIPLAAMNAVGAEGRRDLGDPLLPGWMNEGGVVPLPGEFGPAEGRLFMPDFPLHSAADALQAPLLAGQLAGNQVPGLEGVVPDPGPTGWEELLRSTWNTAGVGGIPGGVTKSIVEGMTGEQLFSGREYQPGEQLPVPGYTQLTGDKVPFEVKLLIENLFPLAGRAATFFPTSEYEKRAQGRRAESMFFGVNAPRFDSSVEASAYRERVKLLDAFIKKVRSDQTGDVPRTSKKSSAGLSSGGGGRESGSSRSSGGRGADNPFG